jgi:hypothetical protein
MDQATLTPATLALLDAQQNPVAGQIYYDADFFIGQIVPSQPLAPGAPYTIRIDGSVAASNGASFGSPVSVAFATGSGPALGPIQFAGVASASASGASGATLAWLPASSPDYAASELYYSIHGGASAQSIDYATLLAIAPFGATQAQIQALPPGVNALAVRAWDLAGNTEPNTAAIALNGSPAPTPATGPRNWTSAPAIVELAGAPEVISVGDVHGDYEVLAALFAATGVIAAVPASPQAARWAAGQDVLICTGDLIDKYTDSLDAIALFRTLEQQAAAAGGRVIVTMGNHEAEFLSGAGGSAKALDFENELTRAGIAPADVAAGQDALGIGAWMRALPFAAKVGDWFFCHAGNTAGMSLAQLRQALVSDVDQNGFGASMLVGADSMLEAKLHPTPWWEGIASASGSTTQAAADKAELTAYVSALGANHLVIGHQPVAVSFSDGTARPADAMFAQFNGLLFLTDTGMSRGVDSALGAVLRIDGIGTARPSATALFADGTSRVLLR